MPSSPREPGVDPSAFDLPGAGAAAALCLHGLTGTPYEVRPLGEALAARGVRALGPWLPGHDESPERLARTRHTDWLEAARAHLRALASEHEAVFAIGISMGGLVSLALAAEEPVRALVVVGTPLGFSRATRLAVPVLRHVRPLLPKRGSDIRDEAARMRHPSMTQMPLASVQELMRLQARVRAGLVRVTAPILVAHGAHDRTARPADARAIRDGVSSGERELLMLPDSGHVATVDHDGPALARAVADFVERHA